jgi:hypothetical protein
VAEDESNSRLKRDAGFWKRDAGFWKRNADMLDEVNEDDVDKRAKYFLGKRPSKFFLGKRDWEGEEDELQEEDWKRGLRQPFLGKRAMRQPFLGKRARYFLGKRDDESDNIESDMNMEMANEDLEKRAKYFLGKRAKYFLGKRGSSSDLDALLKRAKYFLGKRSEEDEKIDYDNELEKRQKYFLGKREMDKIEKSN